jgi:hypothetical protein
MPSGGDYLNKDDLIRNQDEPFGVKNCVFDEKGGNYGARWVLTLIPWFDGQEDPKGLLTFDANPTRNPFFEDLQVQIEENDNDAIGPLTLVKGKTQKGFRYYTLDDWTEDGPANGPAPVDAPAPAPARPARPAASAPEPEAAAKADPPADKPKRGRPRKDSATPSSPATPSASTAEPSATKPPATAIDPSVQEIKPANFGSVVCPDCKTVVEGRILPDDSGRRFIIHPFCPVLNKATVVEVPDA